MNYSSILIVTYGRSGSTLLQGLLNSIDSCRIGGENYSFCAGLYQSYRSLRRTSTNYGTHKRENSPAFPWFGAGAFDETQFLEDARALVTRQLTPNTSGSTPVTCCGFKEIRYLPQELRRVGAEFTGYLDFLAKLFPDPAFLFLTRNHDEVVKSGWWARRDPKLVRKQLQKFDEQASNYAAGKPWTFQITYEDMVGRAPRLAELFQFLGAPYDAGKIDAVLSQRHSIGIRQSTEHEYRNYKVIVEEVPGVEDIVLTSLPFRILDEGIRLGGVIVLSRDLAFGSKLMAQDASGERMVPWTTGAVASLRKPFAKPNIRARFGSEELRISRDGPVALSVVDSDGRKKVLARVVLL
jgi:hypothetical protein